jgi:hypothetical protein
MGEKMFNMQRIGRQEFALDANHDVVHKLHVGFRCRWNEGLMG